MATEPDGTQTFIASRRRLESVIERACASGGSWAERVAAATQAGLEWVEGDPEAGEALAGRVVSRDMGLDPEFAELVEQLAAMLGRGAPAVGRPERTARNTVLLLARQVLLYIETRPGGAVTEIAPDLIVFALTPYVGMEEARLRSSVEIEYGDRRRK